MFNIGDKVKVLPGATYNHTLKVGTICEVVYDCTEYEKPYIWLKSLDEEDHFEERAVHPSELELVETNLLTDEEIQAIDDQTHFHESVDWSIRFARSVLKAAEDKKKMGNNNVLG